MLKIITAIVASAVLAAVVAWWVTCPCSYIPGGPLSGEEVIVGVDDWSFVNDNEAVPLCQIEVAFLLPRSMNVNCMSSEGELYVSCMYCAKKQWAAKALAEPDGRIKVAGNVYPVRYHRVMEAPALDRAWTARLDKTGRGQVQRPGHWWSFRLESR